MAFNKYFGIAITFQKTLYFSCTPSLAQELDASAVQVQRIFAGLVVSLVFAALFVYVLKFSAFQSIPLTRPSVWSKAMTWILYGIDNYVNYNFFTKFKML
ncbi:hypothetical protein [Lampropedia hyalina]|uniref:hypothetical protein n=1 Tax=Lampropedia hyalina TaxID=198706 RepID=UPI00190EB503|nr:hypothetical protein [Lampropedia hyalina]